MNRADRRKMAKNGYNAKGEKVYNLTQKQLDDIVIQAVNLKRKEILEMVSNKVTTLFTLFCLDVLHSKFGFGNMRLKRFKYFLDDIAESVELEYCSAEDIAETLSEKMDISFMYRPVTEKECYDHRHYEK